MSLYKHTRSRVCLLAIIAFGLSNTVVWLWIDTRPPRWDEAGYLSLSLHYHTALTSGGVGSLVASLLRRDRVRPTLVPALAVPAYLLFGRAAKVAFAVNCLALIVLILAVYGLGAGLVSRRCGLLAAFLVSVYPGVFSLVRLFLLDFCDMALVAAALYCLVRTQGFAQKGPALAFGVVVGLGLLCRAFFPLFLLGPLSITVYTAWRAGQPCTRTEGWRASSWYSNGRLALLACTAVAAPWYLVNIIPLVRRSFSAAYGAEAVGYGPTNPLTLHALVSYYIDFTNIHPSPVGMVLFVLAVVVLWRQRAALRPIICQAPTRSKQALLLLLSAFLLPYLCFATLPSQDIKNIAPVLPAMAVITAWGLSLLRPPALQQMVLGCSMVWTLFQFWLGTYGWAALPPQVEIDLGGHLPQVILLQQGLTYPPGEKIFLPQEVDWRIPTILSQITGGFVTPAGKPAMLRPALVAILPDHPFFNRSNFDYVSLLHNLPVQLKHPGDPRSPEGKQYRVQLLEADFVVTKTGDVGPQWLNAYNEEIMAFLRSPDSGFVAIEPPFPLPDGSQAVLYAARSGRSITPEAVPLSSLTPIKFGNEMELVGYTLQEEGHTIRGWAFLITYYWKALREIPGDYQIVTQVTEGAGAGLIKDWSHPPARGRYPTSFWQSGMVYEDRGVYFLPTRVPAGSYALQVGVDVPVSGASLTVTQGAPGMPLDDQGARVTIGTIRIPSLTGYTP